MVSNSKEENNASTPGNMMLISFLYQIILLIGESILLGGSKIGDEVLNVSGVDEKFSGC